MVLQLILFLGGEGQILKFWIFFTMFSVIICWNFFFPQNFSNFFYTKISFKESLSLFFFFLICSCCVHVLDFYRYLFIACIYLFVYLYLSIYTFIFLSIYYLSISNERIKKKLLNFLGKNDDSSIISKKVCNSFDEALLSDSEFSSLYSCRNRNLSKNSC